MRVKMNDAQQTIVDLTLISTTMVGITNNLSIYTDKGFHRTIAPSKVQKPCIYVQYIGASTSTQLIYLTKAEAVKDCGAIEAALAREQIKNVTEV